MTSDFDRENRRETRIDFEVDCLMEPLAPAWTMLAKPLKGMTINITEHGVRLLVPDFPTSRYRRWESCLESGDSISVSIQVQRGPATPVTLEGQIVWLRFDVREGEERGTCSLGILLAVLDDETRSRLRELIEAGVGESPEDH